MRSIGAIMMIATVTQESVLGGGRGGTNLVIGGCLLTVTWQLSARVMARVQGPGPDPSRHWQCQRGHKLTPESRRRS